MTEYHLSKGEARRCRIVKRSCPFGGSHLTRTDLINHVQRSGETITLTRSDYTLTYRKTTDGVAVLSSLSGNERLLGQSRTRRRKPAQTAVEASTPVPPRLWTDNQDGNGRDLITLGEACCNPAPRAAA